MTLDRSSVIESPPVAEEAPEYVGKVFSLDRQGLRALIDSLRRDGYQVIGPTVRDQAIVLEEIDSIEDLPEGWTAEQDAGRYRLRRRRDKALFGYAVGPSSWKRFLFPPERPLWRAERRDRGFEILSEEPPVRKMAFLGVRPCELAAMAIQDKVFLGGKYVDGAYKALRERALLIAVNCVAPGGTCFCGSMGTGPKAEGGFDLLLTERVEGGVARYTVEAGSVLGFAGIREIDHKPARSDEQKAAREAVEQAARRMGRALDTEGIAQLLNRNFEHPRWEQVARRCLTCGSCTMVCPTCFCYTVEDTTDLTGAQAERRRRWDSCFNIDFSQMAGGSVRSSAAARYRQWMTHKLANWLAQYGASGCVGCGRCITWCPVGIDLTEEADAIRRSEIAARTGGTRKGA